jgi:gluconolactonase
MMKKNLLGLIIVVCTFVTPAPVMAQPEEAAKEIKKESMIKTVEWKKIVADLEFPEGPAWDGKGTLYFSSCYGEYIGKISPNGYQVFLKSETTPELWQRTNGMTIGADGNLYACEWAEKGGGILMITPAGKITFLVKDFEGARFNRPNDLAFGPNGWLYFTDPKSYGKDKPDGVVYAYNPETKKTIALKEGLCFCNGLAFSNNGKFLFVAESAQNRVLKLPVKDDGTLGEMTIFAQMPGGDPDGMAFDAEGTLYVPQFGGGVIWVFNPDGTLKNKIQAPGKQPSNIEFGGVGMKTMYVTEDETNSVYTTNWDVAGRKLLWQ